MFLMDGIGDRIIDLTPTMGHPSSVQVNHYLHNTSAHLLARFSHSSSSDEEVLFILSVF